MTTCPHCGRVADELVCANCGMSLALARRIAAAAGSTAAARSSAAAQSSAAAESSAATASSAAAGAAGEPAASLFGDLTGEDDGSAPAAGEVRMWRLGVLVGATCLLAVATAIVLLHYGGGGSHSSGSALARPTTSTAPTATTQATTSAPRRSGGSPTPSVPPRTTSSPAASSSAKPRPARKPIEVGAKSSAPTTTTPTTTAPPTPRSTSPSASPSVQLARGASDPNCGPHCYQLVVTLSDFGSGTQHVTCWSGHDGAFGSYSTASPTSTGCSYRHPRDSVWVILDGRYRSNTVTW